MSSRGEAVRPIRPEEVGAEQRQNLPPEAIKAWNGLIAANFRGRFSSVSLSSAVAALREAGFSDRRIDKENLLRIEETYRDVGWDVEYRQALESEGETESYYIFTSPRRPRRVDHGHSGDFYR